MYPPQGLYMAGGGGVTCREKNIGLCPSCDYLQQRGLIFLIAVSHANV